MAQFGNIYNTNKMEIQIKNKHIFFAVENCWSNLDYRFKAHINNLVSADSEDETVQTLTINKDTFIQVMNAVNSQPQGIALAINPEMYDSLKEQVLKQAAEGNTEAIEIAQEMASILVANDDMLSKKILNGKTQILN